MTLNKGGYRMKPFMKKSKFGKKNFSRAGAHDRTEGHGSARANRPEGKSFSRSDDRPKRFESGFEKRAPQRDGGFKPELFQTICARCGKQAIVPFRPIGNKPILCKMCFSQKESFEPGTDRFEHRGKPHDRFESRPRPDASSATLDMINRKLDKIMRALKIE
jgi:CxxC-x17-CxxC domain-containing protein